MSFSIKYQCLLFYETITTSTAISVHYTVITILYKKHLDASVKERPRTLLVPSEEIFSMFYVINILNTIYYL